VGNFVGSVTASDYAGAVVLGNFRGSVSAGLDGFLLGEGNLTASLSAGRDAYVWTLGNVLGSYQAGQDIAVVAYGSVDAKVAAGRDVGYVWARGNLTGVISAGRNIGRFEGNYYYDPYDYDVFSYGSIDAVIVAPNTSGGKIGGVGAWYEIAGQVRAATSIGTVHAGDEITATIVAPQIGSVIEDDASLRTSHPYPSTPESIKDAVLAEAATVYGEVLAARAEVGTDIEEALAAIAADRARAFNDRSEVIAEVKAANAKNKADAANGLGKAWQEAAVFLAQVRSEAMQALAVAQAEANAAYQTLTAELARIKALRNAAYDQAVALWNKEERALAKDDQTMAEARLLVLGASIEEKATRDLLWGLSEAEALNLVSYRLPVSKLFLPVWRQTKTPGEQVYRHVWVRKAIVAQLVASRQKAIRRSLSPEDKALYEEYLLVRASLSQLLAPGIPRTNETSEDLKVRLAKLSERKEQLERTLATTVRQADHRVKGDETRFEGLPAAMGVEGIFVDFVLYPDWRVGPVQMLLGQRSTPSYAAFVVKPDGSVSWIELGPAASIDDAVKRWRSEIIGQKSESSAGRQRWTETCRGGRSWRERLRNCVP